jgi:hypothetical protein
MYVLVSPKGSVSFRLDYRLNSRRETVTFGKYGSTGLSLARARELCIDAKRAIKEGRSPAIEKQRAKRRLLEAKSFGELGEKWLKSAPMADSTRAMRRTIFERELLPVWRKRLLTEITPDDIRAHCGTIVERGAPATAIHMRDIVKQIYGFAILHGEKVANPADEVGPLVNRPLHPERPFAFADRNPHHAQAARARGNVAYYQAGSTPLSSDDGPQERAAGRDVERSGFRERCLDDSEGAHEADEGT